MTTAAEKKAQEEAAAAAAAEAEAASDPKPGTPTDRDLVVIKHPKIALPAITTRKVAEGVYKEKGWSIDSGMTTDEARTLITETRAKLKG